jgi:hypothetical protein
MKEGYHPETLIHSLLKSNDALRDYGTCTERAGSLWAFLGYLLEKGRRDAFDMVVTTPQKEEE